jgi:arylsulfatase A-like enzyme
VSHVDVLPTILDTISVRYAHALKGQNLLTRREDRLVFSETHRQGSKYTLIVNNMKFIEGDTYELYDIEKDFSENENLMKGRRALDFFSPKADPLKTRLDAIRQQDALRLGAPIFWSIESPMRKELRGLGYVQ